MMSSMVLSSPLSGLSHSKLITNSKNSSSPSKSLCIYFSNKNISLEFSSKSSFMHGDFTFPSPNLSTFVSKSQSSNIITAQTSPLGEHVIYDFQAKEKRRGLSLSCFREKVVLIVNVPEQGSVWTESQYDLLHHLYDKYKSQGFEIAAFLYNKKETDKAGHRYAQKAPPRGQLQISAARFRLFDKVKVNGPRAHPLFVHLRSKFGMGKAITTEFHKFLVDRNGVPYKSFGLDTPGHVIEEEVKLLLLEDAD
ncbi:probable phospholipid hydroperoxide glutathione peroxidase [Solanum dulcamara]|uniref:probable phospholipid hydroperoxide glutathione peroxidase n=1 Tax=Solanum dulcamara TaxID=45834 RepID=UPI0024859078|nr:probable phospholipid hydroperoxide glutathione peroxidase [Solanum dulcamara]